MPNPDPAARRAQTSAARAARRLPADLEALSRRVVIPVQHADRVRAMDPRALGEIITGAIEGTPVTLADLTPEELSALIEAAEEMPTTWSGDREALRTGAAKLHRFLVKPKG